MFNILIELFKLLFQGTSGALQMLVWHERDGGGHAGSDDLPGRVETQKRIRRRSNSDDDNDTQTDRRMEMS